MRIILVDNHFQILIAVTALSFLGFLGYGMGLLRKSKLELKYHKSPQKNGVAERFRKRIEGDTSDLMGMFPGKNDMDDNVSKNSERG